MKVAFLGTGIMGGPMAVNLVKAGHDVTVWNRTAAKAQLVQDACGARVAISPAEAAADCQIVWICVSDTAAVERVLLAEDGVLGVARPGLLVADSSTISPVASQNFAARLRERGAELVDCPVTGSKRGAEAGELIFIVGGKQESIERLEPLFSAMGQRVFAIGGNGMGLVAKLAMNLNIALIFQGFAEGLVLAEKGGVRVRQMLEIIGATMLRSGVVEYKGPFIERRDFTANFPLALMLKDIHLMLDFARENRVKLPALETVEEIYTVAAEEGLAGADYAAILTLLEKWAGLRSPAPTPVEAR
jgi:3-hydroxyisobutyrate dehydrogenase-like beta-hydroxyacid dehydrogenase